MKIVRLLLSTAALALLGASEAMAAKNVELLHGTVRSVGHEASGRAAVVLTGRPPGADAAQLPHRSRPAGPRLARAAQRALATEPSAATTRTSAAQGQQGQPAVRDSRSSVDLRRYRSVIFWCVPFTTTLARANLTRS